MSDVPVYAVVNLQINDAAAYRQYEKGFFPLLKKYGREFITYYDAALTLEGIAPRKQVFPLFRGESENRTVVQLQLGR